MHLLDILFPKRCVGCGKIGRYFCDRCRGRIRPIAANEQICPMCGRLALDGVTHPRCQTRYSIDGLIAFFHYDGPVQKAIKAIKYRYISDLAEEFMSLVRLPMVHWEDSVLVPMPLHPSRIRSRGFNQTEVLGRFLPLPMRTDILHRTVATKPQAEMKRNERLRNMKDVFVSRKISGSIVLFDDVFTTGATMRAAAKALKRSGAKTIWALTIAR